MHSFAQVRTMGRENKQCDNHLNSSKIWVALRRAVCLCRSSRNLLGAGVLGDSLGSLRHSVLGQFTGQQETDSGLDLPGRDGGTPVVVGQTGGFSSDALEDVIDKAVHDGHGLAGDAGVGVHLLEDLVDVDRVALSPPPSLLLVPRTLGFCLGGGLLGSLGTDFWRHVARLNS